MFASTEQGHEAIYDALVMTFERIFDIMDAIEDTKA